MTDGIMDLDLDAGLRELSQLLLANETIDSMLGRVAGVACRCGPVGVGVTISLVGGREPRTAVATDERARTADDRQYEALEGPLLDAVKTGEVQVVGCLGGADDRYPAFSPTAAALGIVSVVVVPLTVDGGSVGALTLYSDLPDAFDR